MDIRKEAIILLVKILLETEITDGNISFLKIAYDNLRLYDNKRILKTNKKSPKVASKLTDGLYENIAAIIVEEIENDNTEILELFMQYYANRVPNINDIFLKYGNSQEKYFMAFKNLVNGNDVIKKLYVMIYYLVNKDDCEFAKKTIDTYQYKTTYEWNNLKSKSYVQHLEKLLEVEDLVNNKIFQKYIKKQRKILAEYLEIEADALERYVVYMSACTKGIEKNLVEKVHGSQFCWIEESLFKILDKHFISTDCIVDTVDKEYAEIVKDNFENLCAATIYYKYVDYANKNEKLTLSMIIRQASIEDVQMFYIGLISSFYFELLARELNKVLEEYYKIFSFDKILNVNREQELLDEISRLKLEIGRYKEKIGLYTKQEFEEKQKQYTMIKKEDRDYIEKITILEKQLEEQKRLNKKQQQRLQEQEEYISLLKVQDTELQQEEDIDVSVFSDMRMVFIGGMQELIIKLKPIFTNSVFISDETVMPPTNIDAIIMFPKFMSHALFYKYVAMARENNIKIIYCNSNNVDIVMGEIGKGVNEILQ